MNKTKNILFFVESLSFGHVVRAQIVAERIRKAGCSVVIACGQGSVAYFKRFGFETHTIPLISSEVVYSQRLAKGLSIHDEATLTEYFHHDAELIERLSPDLVITEFRFTVAQIAKSLSIPCITLTETPCHPAFVMPPSLPNSALVRPYALASLQDKLASISWLRRQIEAPIVAKVSEPYQRASEAAGFEPLNSFFDYTVHGDLCLIADDPSLFPLSKLRPQDHYIGGLYYAGDKELPATPAINPNKPSVYVSLGTQTSLDIGFLSKFADDVLANGVQLVISKGNQARQFENLNKEVVVVDFVDEYKFLQEVDLYIYPGGAISTYLALNLGVKMLAIPSHINQHCYAYQLYDKGFGRFLRPKSMTAKSLSGLVMDMLSPDYSPNKFVPQVAFDAFPLMSKIDHLLGV